MLNFSLHYYAKTLSNIKKVKDKNIILNEKDINIDDKKFRLISKIAYKVVKNTNKNYTIRNLTHCAVKNYKNMSERINKCAINASSSKRHASSPLLDLNLSKRCKKHITENTNILKKRAAQSKNIYNLNVSDTFARTDKKKCASGKKETFIGDEDVRLKLIKRLIDEQKIRFSFIASDVEDDYSDSSIISEEYAGRELTGARSLKIVKELRKLPDYEKIDKFLNSKQKKLISKAEKNSSHWNTTSFLLAKIEQSISNNDWNNVTNLLLFLADDPKSYKPFLLRIALMNIICNPVMKGNTEVLEEFLRSCYSCQTDEDMQKVLAELFHLKRNEMICIENDKKDDEEQNF